MKFEPCTFIILFLIFSDFEPYYSYRPYSYRKCLLYWNTYLNNNYSNKSNTEIINMNIICNKYVRIKVSQRINQQDMLWLTSYLFIIILSKLRDSVYLIFSEWLNDFLADS